MWLYADDGRAFVYYGGATGLDSSWSFSPGISQANAYLGTSVSTAGDVAPA